LKKPIANFANVSVFLFNVMNTCTKPGTFADWEFEASLDGAPSPEFTVHIAECAACAQRLGHLQREADELNQVLPEPYERQDCPNGETLLAYRWGALDVAQQAVLARHLQTCAFCADDVAQLLGPISTTVPILRAPGMTPDADDLLMRVGRTLSVIAARLFSPPAELIPALRGDPDATEKAVLTYKIAERDWELMLMPSAQAAGYMLSGQLLGPSMDELSMASVTVLADNQFVQEAALDDSGWFDLPDLPPGRYVLWLETPEVRIEVADVKLGAAA
jgi:anti-sigma factor RsiW